MKAIIEPDALPVTELVKMIAEERQRETAARIGDQREADLRAAWGICEAMKEEGFTAWAAVIRRYLLHFGPKPAP